ncbi:hypothetical protein QE369_000683 [Agrobacterium larrymoorei]|uniref:Uncharacterized protein n=1 Tax=Agrobacterium larrymoorei TaxID=160699 RepID=A0AAJ2BIY2_9HYPH|nr:hypothetical protein [Agrobacterium larrymoorei]MDR6100505.1 hypothetical protein [Agrobacterium larrymoorei]
MAEGTRYSDQRRKWWDESLGERLVDSRTILPREGHSRIKVLADQLGERVPILLGKFVMASLSMFDLGKTELPTIEAAEDEGQAAAGPPTQVILDEDVFQICAAIAASRFPQDTGSTRMRQCAMMMMIASEMAAGRRPTMAGIARYTGSPPSPIIALATTLEERGLLMRVRMPGVSNGKSGKVLQIRSDAVQAINNAHLEQTGMPIIPINEKLSADQHGSTVQG